MKKIILSFTIAAAILSSSFTYAADKEPVLKEPSIKAKQAFSNEFAKVTDVEWTTMAKEGVYQAKFTFNNESLQAFFTEEGDFLGTTRQITKSQLPILVLNQLGKKYPDAHVLTIFEYSKQEGLEYYITITNDKGGQILQASGNGEVSVYKKNLK